MTLNLAQRSFTTYLFTYLHSWFGEYKTGNISETVEDKAKVNYIIFISPHSGSMAYIKSYIGFRLPPKCMKLNDLWARFKIIDSLIVAKVAKYSLVMAPTPESFAFGKP